MRKCFEYLAALLLVWASAVQTCVADDAVVLFWMYDEIQSSVTDVNGGVHSGVGSFDYITPIDGRTPEWARIKVTSTAEDFVPVYLQLYDKDGVLHDDWTEAEITDGRPEYGRETGAQMAASTSYTTSDFTYFLELGYYDDKGEWVMMASSVGESFENIAKFTSTDPLVVPSHLHWIPSVNVPEPSSALLMLVGGALLALKRKRQIIVKA